MLLTRRSARIKAAAKEMLNATFYTDMAHNLALAEVLENAGMLKGTLGTRIASYSGGVLTWFVKPTLADKAEVYEHIAERVGVRTAYEI